MLSGPASGFEQATGWPGSDALNHWFENFRPAPIVPLA